MGLFGSKEDPEDLMYHAMSLMEKNQPKAAISLFNKVLKQNSENISAIFNKGLALNRIKKYSDAVTCFDKLLQINPKDAQAFKEYYLTNYKNMKKL
jgi:tetratricopeptide (TPR) repeat protein